MRILPTVRDSRDRESHTLFFVAIAVGTLFIKFVAAGVDIPVIGKQPTMSATEFAAAFGVVMAVWLGREWVRKE